MKTKSKKGTSRRFSDVLSETLSKENFLSETLGPVAPYRVAPSFCKQWRFACLLAGKINWHQPKQTEQKIADMQIGLKKQALQ